MQRITKFVSCVGLQHIQHHRSQAEAHVYICTPLIRSANGFLDLLGEKGKHSRLAVQRAAVLQNKQNFKPDL